MARQRGMHDMAPVVPFLNPDLITKLIVWSNKAPIIIDGQKGTVLIDLGAQVSSVSSGYCEWMALRVHLLVRLLELEGTRVSAILYLG